MSDHSWLGVVFFFFLKLVDFFPFRNKYYLIQLWFVKYGNILLVGEMEFKDVIFFFFFFQG